ncbi:2-dehydro-3-deoxygluconokinase [Streptomyces ambofaciens ATCC 23877]|uniref:2-dehydro-3-deoxygluconokinase n=1 Tax=Streptomyces ambofaciens (strain ATCC 23877 / 3486 / DSM 40053 / JCM 4204 / NBRC 12836 / NRRL B-2516) TaxID=278992 RepID=A0AE21_STRA7|nr:sugar kinase [Streptomyces ambofaciens]AKZ59595.1 2-dehydro-3-deoxygluconokinase [Streptomyces ambofaciens ATCC 23877]CAJ88729.1 putative sugar kinase [Streptomyces ambofaciens ATCC 23877]
MTADVLTFGETMLSLQTEGPLTTGSPARTAVAGAESNVAVGLARLGHRVSWAGRLGADEPARLVLRTLRGEGVDVRHATTDPEAPTGALMRERLAGDVTRVHYWRAGSAASRQRPEHLTAALAEGARILHVTGITCALGPGPLATVAEAVEYGREHGWTVVLDVNHRARLWEAEEAARVLRRLRGCVDILIASDDELPLIAGDDGADETARVTELLAAGAREVVVKRGGDGADVYGADGRHLHQPAHRVPVVDTVGAGDAFCAGYLSGLLDGLAPADRLRRAATTGAFAVAARGDWEGLPHRDELALLNAPAGSALR